MSRARAPPRCIPGIAPRASLSPPFSLKPWTRARSGRAAVAPSVAFNVLIRKQWLRVPYVCIHLVFGSYHALTTAGGGSAKRRRFSQVDSVAAEAGLGPLCVRAYFMIRTEAVTEKPLQFC
jgi:hypothetical protein